MKLYYAPGSCGLASQIALREAGQIFELVNVDFASKRTAEGNYYDVSPKGFVPVLSLDDGQILTEGAVILQWIADHVPKRKLLAPMGTMARYRGMEWLNYIATDLHKGMAVMFSPFVDATSKVRFAEGNLAARFKYVNEHLTSSSYLVGDSFSVADGYLYNILSWAPRVNIDLSPYAAIGAFMARMENRPSVRDAVAAERLAAA